MKHTIKRNMDWTGLIAVFSKPIRNSKIELPKGTICVIREKNSKGLTLQTAPCTCCGAMMFVTRVSEYDISITSAEHYEYNKARISWNQGCKFKNGRYGRYLEEPNRLKPVPKNLPESLII